MNSNDIINCNEYKQRHETVQLGEKNVKKTLCL